MGIIDHTSINEEIAFYGCVISMDKVNENKSKLKLLYLQGYQLKFNAYSCGLTVISDEWVMTAAHCIFAASP